MKISAVLVSVAAVAALTACSGGGGEGANAPKASPAAASPRAGEGVEGDAPIPEDTLDSMSTPAPTQVAPQIGDDALQVGETRRGTGVSTTVAKVRDNYPSDPNNEYVAPDEGQRWLGFWVRTCVTDPSQGTNDISWDQFSVGSDDGVEYSVSGPVNDTWPKQQLPDYVSLAEGCRQGWVIASVPEDAQVDLVRLVPGGTPIAEWRLADAPA